MGLVTPPLVLVAACGNRSAGDDAFGPLVADCLRAIRDPMMEVVDLGMKPAGLLNHVAHRCGVVIVDAVQHTATDPPAALIDMDFRSPDRPPLVHDVALSSHGLSIEHELRLAEKLGMMPNHIHLIAASASCTEVGLPPSKYVLGCIQPAADRIVQLARHWLADASAS